MGVAKEARGAVHEDVGALPGAFPREHLLLLALPGQPVVQDVLAVAGQPTLSAQLGWCLHPDEAGGDVGVRPGAGAAPLHDEYVARLDDPRLGVLPAVPVVAPVATGPPEP